MMMMKMVQMVMTRQMIVQIMSPVLISMISQMIFHYQTWMILKFYFHEHYYQGSVHSGSEDFSMHSYMK